MVCGPLDPSVIEVLNRPLLWDPRSGEHLPERPAVLRSLRCCLWILSTYSATVLIGVMVPK